MRIAMMISAACLLAAGCDRSASAKPAFESASEKECATLALVARDKLRLHTRPPEWLNGMDRDDWRPTCDWKKYGVKFQNVDVAKGWNAVASGGEVTFHRPKFGPEGATVVVETVDYGGHETLITCHVSGYDIHWSLYSCKENDVMPF